MIMSARMLMLFAIFSVLVMPVLAQTASDSTNNAGAAQGDFFIVSSIDLAKAQILLKRPTEVTELMRVGGDTRYFDERGKAIRLTDLRAGDTVYIVSKLSGEEPVAVTIHQGPMTLDILRDRYLKPRR